MGSVCSVGAPVVGLSVGVAVVGTLVGVAVVGVPVGVRVGVAVGTPVVGAPVGVPVGVSVGVPVGVSVGVPVVSAQVYAVSDVAPANANSASLGIKKQVPEYSAQLPVTALVGVKHVATHSSTIAHSS